MRASRLFQVACACALVGGAVFADPPVQPTRSMDFSVARSLPYQTPDQVMFENVIANGQHLALLMKWSAAVLRPVQSRQLTTVQIPERTISIDGNDADWAGIPPVVSDPEGDQAPPYADVPGTDIANVYLAHDAGFLYFRMTLYNGGPITNTGYFVEFQQYLYQLHTPGDILVWPSDEGGSWGVWVADRTGAERGHYSGSDWLAVANGWLEWKVPLADVQNPTNTPGPYFPAAPVDRGIENRFVRAYLHPFGTGAGVADANDEMTRPLIIGFYK